MSVKKRLEYCIGEIRESNISDKTKKNLIRLFMEIWPEYELSDLSFTYLVFPFERGEFLASVPDWLYNVFGINKTKYKHNFDYGYGYEIHVPDCLFKTSYDFSTKLCLIEEKERKKSIDLSRSESIAKSKSLIELEKLKDKLKCELSIVENAIDIKKKDSRQKTYKK